MSYMNYNISLDSKTRRKAQAMAVPSQYGMLLEPVSQTSCRSIRYIIKKWHREHEYKKEQKLKENQERKIYRRVKRGSRHSSRHGSIDCENLLNLVGLV